MFCRIKSATLIGIESAVIEVEVDAKRGLPHQSIVGLPDTAVREARERVHAAIRNSGFEFPLGTLTVNLAPADLRKEGSTFDLAIALGVLIVSGQLKPAGCSGGGDGTQGSGVPEDFIVLGELSLNGQVRPVRGVIAIAQNAKRKGLSKVILPAQNSREAGFISGLRIHPVRSLRDAVGVLSGRPVSDAESPGADRPAVDRTFHGPAEGSPPEPDFSEVQGQSYAVRAAEIAAAGGHNLLLVGPPGSGKTMIASRIPTILPEMSEGESIETTKIYSAAGLSAIDGLMSRRPFRAPHHTASDVSIIGGGKNPIPGEITLAHNGVLFLDEFTEFRNTVVQSLRQPMEAGIITVSRADMRITYPALFMLVASMNPCPCGHLFDPGKECRCSPSRLARYYAKISGPILDRIDIQVEVKPLDPSEVMEGGPASDSRQIRKRVETARKMQLERLAPFGVGLNARMSEELVKRFCRLDGETRNLLRAAVRRYGISTRAYYKILKVARTIADVEGRGDVLRGDVLESLSYREFGNRFYGSSIPNHHTIY